MACHPPAKVANNNNILAQDVKIPIKPKPPEVSLNRKNRRNNCFLGKIPMPNGESKNWIRFILTLESFYGLYGKWPKVIHLYPFFIDELQNKLSTEDFQTLQSKIRLDPNEKNPFLCFDEKGNKYDYARGDICPNNDASVRAIHWLNINEPDYYD